jgi:hypothetical protein
MYAIHCISLDRCVSLALGKIHSDAHSRRRWVPTVDLAENGYLTSRLTGIGPEISQSIKDIYTAAKVGTFDKTFA